LARGLGRVRSMGWTRPETNRLKKGIKIVAPYYRGRKNQKKTSHTQSLLQKWKPLGPQEIEKKKKVYGLQKR